MATLDEWTEQACAALGLERGTLDQALVLDLTREVAHGVARPAAPLAAYLVGVAVGRGTDAAAAAATIAGISRSWPGPEDEPSAR